MDTNKEGRRKPVFDPVRARAIGAKRLERAARRFARAHHWPRRDGAIWMRKSKSFAALNYAELGDSLVRSGGLVKTRQGWQDRYTGEVYH